ncbi:ATP-binding protein, partial [Candidatus Marithioploca araucensis]|nr:ATP-binding protein [Candidatus Marithioploca araucensis]
ANIDILRKVLVNEGYQLFFANSGEKAIKITSRALPDIILLDVMMPGGINGFETCRLLKQKVTTQDIPIIFLTAKNQPEDIKEGFKLGAVDYICKPFQQEEVCMRVRTHLQNSFLMKQRKQAVYAAEAANYAKSAFLANISHELRTPLNGILGYAQVLELDQQLTEKQQESVKTIHSCGQHLLTLINDLLDLSKIEVGHLELYLNDFCLDDFFRPIVELFKIRLQEKKLVFDYQATTPLTVVVHGDDKRLRQIMINLLSNAVKFTEQGSISFSVTYQNNKLYFQVTDTGIGIAPNEIENIFLPFKQVSEMYKKPEGTGLGLAISKTLIEMMGGKLSVESVLGKGSTFSGVINLPQEFSHSRTEKEQKKMSQIEEMASENIIGPSPKQAEKLFHLSMMGHIQGIQDYVEELEETDEKLKPFAQKIKYFAQKVSIREIREVIKLYVDKK